MKRIEDKQQIARFRASSLKDHRLAPADTKSWLVSTHGRKGAHYWYTVTWSYPGVLTVSGDIGSITLTHYHAMDSWVAAAEWIGDNGDHHYLLEKSNHKQVYDPEQTLENIVQWADEEITRVQVTAPEGWGLWLKILLAVGDGHKPNDIFNPTIRGELTDLLRETLDTDQGTAVDLIYRLDLSDYYGSYSWSHESLNLVAALYHWAELVQASTEFTSESTKLRNHAELSLQSIAFDQGMERDPYKYLPGVVECRIGSQPQGGE
jgi:hypothetical protein